MCLASPDLFGSWIEWCGELINLALESTCPPRLLEGSDNAHPSVGAIQREEYMEVMLSEAQPMRAGDGSLYHGWVVGGRKGDGEEGEMGGVGGELRAWQFPRLVSVTLIWKLELWYTHLQPQEYL
jgi:hypothetical protein